MTNEQLTALVPGHNLFVITKTHTDTPELHHVLFEQFIPSDSGYAEVVVFHRGRGLRLEVDKEMVFDGYLSAGLELDKQWEAYLNVLSVKRRYAERERERTRELLRIQTGHTFYPLYHPRPYGGASLCLAARREAHNLPSVAILWAGLAIRRRSCLPTRCTGLRGSGLLPRPLRQ